MEVWATEVPQLGSEVMMTRLGERDRKPIDADDFRESDCWHLCMQMARAYNTSIAPQTAYRSYSSAVHVTDSGRTAYMP